MQIVKLILDIHRACPKERIFQIPESRPYGQKLYLVLLTCVQPRHATSVTVKRAIRAHLLCGPRRQIFDNKKIWPLRR